MAGAKIGEAAWVVVRDAMDRAFAAAADPARAAAVEGRFDALVPHEQREHVRAVLAETKTPTRAYRVGVAVQLAYGVASPARLDLTRRHPGARGATGVAGRLGRLLKDRHVKAPIDAYQSIGKNSKDLIRGNLPEFDVFLAWASEPARTAEEYAAALDFVCLAVARTARPVKAFPDLDRAKLTFAAVMGLFHELLGVESRGAYQQFLVAALLHARVEQDGGKQRVETKKLNAADASSGAAADVQLRSGPRVDEAFEVTANDWTEKLPGAETTIRAHDLARLHIVARVGDVPAMLETLRRQTYDISATDLTGFVSVYTAELLKQYRESALRRLYEFLDRYQPDVDLVNGYVDRLAAHGLTA